MPRVPRLFGGGRAVADALPLPGEWVIEPVGLGFKARVEEIWRYRRLLWFFAQRATQQLYAGTTLGIFWLFGRPLLPLLISTFIFGSLLQVPSEGVPYFLFYLCGSGLWHFFERSMMWVTRSLDRNRGLMKKMYFPRLIVPMSAVVPGFADLGVYIGLMFLAAFYYLWKDGRWYLTFGPGWLVSLGMVFLTVVLLTACGLFTAVWQVKHREVRFTIRYFMRFWSYLTPVIYPMSQVPPNLRWVLYLNPMASIVEAYKWGLLGIGSFPAVPLLCTLVLVPFVFAAGVWYFSTSEAASVDEL